MPFKPQPCRTHARARAMVVNFLDAMAREAEATGKAGDKTAESDIRAVINVTKNCADLSLKDRG